ncbi:MAG TPA: tetratricopeptide repeat protein [Gammaproteobacteria bacterium]|nr:tetratricopeptide repeat protein [Gammaproteobacteria bacterium]
MKSLTRGKKKQALQLLANNRILEARALFEKICQNDRRDIEAWIYLVKVNAQLGDAEAVGQCCRTIIGIRPDLHEAHFHLGTSLLIQGKREEALESFRKALRLQPNNPSTLFQLGKALHLLTRFDEALEYYEQALGLAPNLAEVYDSIGSILKYRGDLEGAIKNYRQALQIRPNFDKAHSDLVFALNYSPRYDADAIYREHVRWGQMHKLPPVASSSDSNPDPTRRLRVGYVSPDLCKHSVAFFFEPLLTNHDPIGFETFCYSDVAKPDAVTQRLQEAASHWRATKGMDDGQLAERIRLDGIDILVDLTGHTANSRLMAFTAKPAPIQVSYLGYPNTTGIPAIDYRLTDAWADPPGITDDYHTETLIRLLNGFLCYQPGENAPPVTPSPARKCGHITFGSFNNLAKITPEVVSLWSSVLKTSPDSRLIVKNISLHDTATREHYLQLFKKHAIDPDRLDLLPPKFFSVEHLELYGKIDIGLDTFPYNGTTTTCEAFWMGVPVIALAGNIHAGRVGVSLLSQLGLTEFIAGSLQDYVRLATELAADRDRLSRIREALRERMAESALCNGEAFTHNVEDAYRDMWVKWCKKHQNGSQDLTARC